MPDGSTFGRIGVGSWFQKGQLPCHLALCFLDLLHMVCSGSELLPLWLTGRRGREGGIEGGRTRDKIRHPKGLPATFQRFQNLSK